METTSEEALENIQENIQEEIPELSVENPCVIEDIMKDFKELVETEEIQLIYKPPRFYRSSILYKTVSLFSTPEIVEKPKKKEPVTQKAFWIFIMIVTILLAFSITIKIWQRYQRHPLMTNLILSTNEVQSYPTVTVCPQNSESPEKIVKMIQQHGLKLNNSKEIEEFLSAIPNFSYGGEGLRSIVLSEVGSLIMSHFNVKSVRNLIFRLAKSCHEVFNEECKFKGETIDCCKAFLPVFGEHGFCYAFNAKNYGENETPNNNFFKFAPFDDTMMLSVDLKIPSKIFINAIEETLRYEQSPLVETSLYNVTSVLVSMQTTKTDENAKSLPKRLRKCIFNKDVQLKYSKESYTFSGCLKESKIDRAIQLCGCLPPFYVTNNFMPCSLESLKCLKDERILDTLKSDHCELACDFTVYSVEKVQTGPLSEDEIQKPFGFTLNFNHYPLIYKQEVRFGFIDLLVAFGSILALFLGLSLLSFLEMLLNLFHFIVIKICRKKDFE